MRIQIQIGGTECLLTPQQAESLYNILQDCEVMDTRWTGAGKGIFGRELDQDISFRDFDAAHHAQGVKVWPEQMLDKYKTLIEYRDK